MDALCSPSALDDLTVAGLWLHLTELVPQPLGVTTQNLKSGSWITSGIRLFFDGRWFSQATPDGPVPNDDNKKYNYSHPPSVLCVEHFPV